MIPTKDASLIVLTFKNKVLLVLRDDKPDIASPNMWCFPGGVKEEHETFEETCLREVKEELNLSFSSLEFIVNIEYDDRNKYFYHATLTHELAESIILSEGQKYDFFTIDELNNLKLTKSSELFIRDYSDLLKKLLSK